MCDTWEASFLLWPWKTLTPNCTNSIYFSKPTGKIQFSYSAVLFLSCCWDMLHIIWPNFASSKPVSAISLCMGFCQVVSLTEHLWPRLGACLSRLGVTINYTYPRDASVLGPFKRIPDWTDYHGTPLCGVPGLVTGYLWGVWGHELTTCSLCISKF